MAATAAVSIPHIPVGEYLGSVYRPDVDYVDGMLEERNVGEIDHATLQRMLLLALIEFEESAEVFAIQEVRVQIHATRFRVPDVCLISAREIPETIITVAPLLCVEVLSPRDSVMSMRARCMDYLRMGVPEVWIFDPASETAYVMRKERLVEVQSGTLSILNGAVSIQVEDVFAKARKRSRRLEKR